MVFYRSYFDSIYSETVEKGFLLEIVEFLDFIVDFKITPIEVDCINGEEHISHSYFVERLYFRGTSKEIERHNYFQNKKDAVKAGNKILTESRRKLRKISRRMKPNRR